MIGFAQWPEIGAVGAKLIFPDNTVQHAGVFLPGGNPAHPYYRYTINHPGHFFSNMVHRNWSAVTGACLMTRAELFHSSGEFDCQFPLNFNDVEYCLRLGDQGLRMVCVPQAQLYHYESLTRTAHVRPEEISRIHELFRKRYRWDPYYNPNLATDYSDFRVDPIARITPPPARVAPAEEPVSADAELN
jgi:GT2 family glycosyltransferase